MRIIFMGTPDFSVGTLNALIEAGHEIVLAVTQPDKPKGRGKAMQYTPVKEAALEHGIEVYQPKRVREKECVEYLRNFSSGYDRSCGIRTDPAKGDPGYAEILLCQCTRIPAPEIQRSGAHSVGGDQR